MITAVQGFVNRKVQRRKKFFSGNRKDNGIKYREPAEGVSGLAVRKLAAVSFSFAAAVLLSQYLLPGAWQPYFAAALCALGFAALLLRRSAGRLRTLLVLFGLAAGFFWNWGYTALFCAPADALIGQTAEVSAVVDDFPVGTAYGVSADLYVRIAGHPAVKTLAYFDAETGGALRPGDEIVFTASFSSAGKLRDQDSTYLTSKGYVLTAKKTRDLTVSRSPGFRLRYLHRWAAKAVKEEISRVFPADTAGFMRALLTGDRLLIKDDAELTGAMKRTGVYHIVAVSGLHVAILAGFVFLLAGRRRRTALVVAPVLLLFAGISGFTPSVVRAVVMQYFLLAAPLFDRESDGVTSLSAALLAILLADPAAATSAGLQLSFAATLGIVLFSDGIYGFLFGLGGRKRHRRKLLRRLRSFVFGGVSATLGATLCTLPLTAVYFGYVSLAAPVTNLLILFAVEPAFCLGAASVAAGFALEAAGKILALAASLPVRYIVWLVKALSGSYLSAVYLDSIWLVVWFALTYAVFVLFAALRESPRKLVAPVCASAIALCAILVATAAAPKDGNLSMTALDVGQGQCLVFTCGDYTAMVDCGSTSGENAGDIAARWLRAAGRERLDLLILTHYHADHANGVDDLLAEGISVTALAAPLPEDEESTLDEKILRLADRYGTEVIRVDRDSALRLGDASFTLFAPLGKESENERCVTILATQGSFDYLVTGDADSALERALLAHTQLPDIECLVAGHHGSKYSTCIELLRAVKPETAVISVGYNTYGQPGEETLARLRGAGAAIFRTDEDGNVKISSAEAGKGTENG